MSYHPRNYCRAICSIIRVSESADFRLDWHSTIKQIILRTGRVQWVRGSWIQIFRLISSERKFTVKWTAARSKINRQILIVHHFNLCSVRQSIYLNSDPRSRTFRDSECHRRRRPTIPITRIISTIRWATTRLSHRQSYSFRILF